MAHRFGAMPMPAAAPPANETLTDPALDVLVDYFKTVLGAHVGTAWNATAPSETLVKRTFTNEPVENFLANDLPSLYIWREKETPSRIADSFEQTQGTLMLMWVYPPTGGIEKHARRLAFFNGFAKTIHRAVYKERDPSWVHSADALDPAANMYGSSVLDKAGLDWWQLVDVRKDVIQVETEHDRFDFPALIAEINIRESEESDPAVTNRVATAIEFTIKQRAVTAQHEIEPDPAP